MPPQLGLAAAANWKAGYETVLSDALTLDGLEDAVLRECLATYAAEQARACLRRVVDESGLTPAEGVRRFGVYPHTFIRGALDQALDGRALRGA